MKAYRYRMIWGIDFYRSVSAELKTRSNVNFYFGEIGSIRDGVDFAEVELQDQIFRGRWVFNSLFRPGEFIPQPGRYTYLKQHFLGWEVEADRDVFDPSAFTMFDFRIPQQGAMRFFYVLPTTTRNALVEYTLFSGKVLEEEEYRSGLRDYLRDVLKVEQYRIAATEFGIIPMTDFPFPRRLGKRVLAIGTRGGRVKPSTGFAFRRI